MTFSKLIALSLATASFLVSNPANATVIININQVGADVVATTSGTLDLTGLTLIFHAIGLANGSINPSVGFFRSTGGPVDVYDGATGPISFGTGPNQNNVGIGDAFALETYYHKVFVPVGYVSGSLLAATSTFQGQTLASLGVTKGSYLFSTPNDTITLSIGSISAVPEPASWAMMLAGFGAMGASIRYRRRRSTKVVLA